MAAKNRRKYKRVPLGQIAVIQIDRRLIGKCTVSDISVGGARLHIDRSVNVPDKFILQFSRNGTVRRRCQQMWRTHDEIGVRFIKENI